jgi:hypothetical protein
MENIVSTTQHEEKVHRRSEWSLKRKAKWPVKKLLTKWQQHMLKRWLRHVDNLSDDRKGYHRGLVDCQVGNDKRSGYLLNYQKVRGEIPIFLVEKGEEMSSTESSCQ